MFLKINYLAVVFLVCVGYVHAKKVPPNCCLPDKFEAFLGVEGGTNAACSGNFYQVVNRFFYDYPEEQWGFITGRVYTSSFSTDWEGDLIMEDFKNHELRRASQKCYVQEMHKDWKMRQFCVPEDAEYVDTVTMGLGDQSLTYDKFKWYVPGKNDTGHDIQVQIITGVTEDCTFINEVAMWEEDFGFKFGVNIGFLDQQPELSEENVFAAFKNHYKKCLKADRRTIVKKENKVDVYTRKSLAYLAHRLRIIPDGTEMISRRDYSKDQK